MGADPSVCSSRRGRTGKPGPVDLTGRICLYEKYRIEPPFVLHFGAAEPRKNTRRVIEAWAGLQQPVKSRAKLLIVGLDAEAAGGAGDLHSRLGIENSVVLNGFADEQDIPALCGWRTCLPT
ncbi:MAG: glycosyltransferase [Phycisphaerales bacterium]